MKQFTIALAGNPNCGKTTLFNALTSSRERVGNWPGVTVEHLKGEYSFDGAQTNVIDLPGIYSFSAGSLDEVAARDYIIKEKPDAIINLIDARNVERGLYLTAQLLEMKVPLIVVVNMANLAKRRHIELDVKHLEEHLGCPVLQVEVISKEEVVGLKQVIASVVTEKKISSTHIQYDAEVEKAIDELVAKISPAAERDD
ncbi:MAG: 50S ribosome-binding GTPase, partial [Kiritimatiellaceae bacterium]|nr:50S ribosome-binding GTPase [Kiritimatiellaceae bacterium]